MARQRRRRERGGDRAGRNTHDSLVREFDGNTRPKARTRRITAIEGRASEGGHNLVSQTEDLETEDAGHNPTRITWIGLYTCDFGHVVGDGNKLVGQCEYCQALLCGARGCTFSCRYCGRVCCRNCVIVNDLASEKVEIYCRRCRWRHLVRFWFGFGG